MAKSDSTGYSSLGTDQERDMGAKGGPTTTLGKPDYDKNISHPYSDDIQTQLAAKSTGNNKENKNNNDRAKPQETPVK